MSQLPTASVLSVLRLAAAELQFSPLSWRRVRVQDVCIRPRCGEAAAGRGAGRWALPDFSLLLQMSWPSRLPSAKSNPNPSFILYCFKSVSSECPICALAWSKSCSAPVPTPRDLGHRAAGWHQAAVGAGKEPPVVRSYRAAGSCTWQLVQSSGSHKLYVELQNTRRWPKLLVKSCCCSSQRDRAQIPGPGF